MVFDQIPVMWRTLPSVPELLIQADTAQSRGTCDLNPNCGSALASSGRRRPSFRLRSGLQAQLRAPWSREGIDRGVALGLLGLGDPPVDRRL